MVRKSMKLTKAKKKRDAVVQALRDFIRHKRMAELVKYSGTFKSIMTNDEIEGTEIARMKRIFGKFDA